jgi:hypothetical protein
MAESERHPVPGQIDWNDITSECACCGERHVGVGVPVTLTIPGMLFPSMEHAVPVFIPDPDAGVDFLRMPNGTLGFITDTHPCKYIHTDCLDDLIEDAAYANAPDEPEEEDEEQ